MFVKIKLESDDSSMKPHIFELADTATVYDLKVEIKRIAGFSVDTQEIKSLSGQMKNNENLSNLLRSQESGEDPEKINGAATSLYNSGVFKCFLQFYSRAEAGAQANFFSLPPESRLMPVDRPPKFLDASDSQDSTMSGGSSCAYSSPSIDSPPGKKRGRAADMEGSPAKRRRISPRTSPKLQVRNLTLTSYATGNMTGLLGSKILTLAKSCKKEPSCGDDDESEEEEAPPCCPKESAIECVDRSRDCCNRARCNKEDTRPPYAITMPEMRRYGLVISHDDPAADTVDVKAIMGHFFSLFENCKVQDLNFSDCTSMARFCGNLLIVCNDDETADWVMSAIAGVCPPHSCLPFIEFFGLVRATVVIPLIVPDKSLCSIFELLELQNCGLVTDKWTVTDRYRLDPCSDDYDQKAVSQLCDNDEIEVYIDQESKNLIMCQCSKLKYCFWRLKFEFCG